MTVKERYAPDIPFIPYLRYPIQGVYKITEGFIYSNQERLIHGFYFHMGLDFDTQYGIPVYAAASGFAVAGYHRFTLHNPDYTLHLHDGKPLGFGQGYFIQIYHPEGVCQIPGGRITQYGHLSSFAPELQPKFLPPREIDILGKIYERAAQRKQKVSPEVMLEQERLLDMYPWVRLRFGFTMSDELEGKESYLYSPADLAVLAQEGKNVVWVEQGQQIGTVGNSAVIWGDLTQPEASPAISQEMLPPLETWDQPHLHFEEATRDWKSGDKHSQRDPFNIYKSARWYQKPPQTSLFLGE